MPGRTVDLSSPAGPVAGSHLWGGSRDRYAASLHQPIKAWSALRAHAVVAVVAHGALPLTFALLASSRRRSWWLIYCHTQERSPVGWLLETLLARCADITLVADASTADELEKRCRMRQRPIPTDDSTGPGINPIRDVELRLGHERPRMPARRGLWFKARVRASAHAARLEAAGQLHEALQVAHRRGDQFRVRRIEGELKTLDPGWRPRLTARAARSGLGGPALNLIESSLPQAPSGYAERSRAMVAAQAACGLQPVVATRLGFPASRGRAFAPVEYVDGIAHHRFWIPGLRHYTAVPRDVQIQLNADLVAPFAGELGASLIWATTPYLNGIVALALRHALRVPFVYDVRGFPDLSAASDEPNAAGARELVRRAEERCLREADLVVTLSQSMAREVTSRGAPEERVMVAPHVVDAERFSRQGDPARLRERHGLGDGVVVGHVSTLRRYEGGDILLEAVARARAQHADVRCLIVGDGPARAELEHRARTLGLATAAVFTGRLPTSALPEHYAVMDIVAIPRRADEVCRAVTPLKAIEALAAGRCVLASDLPALREALGAPAAFVPAGDPEALAAKLIHLAATPAERERRGHAARERAQQGHAPVWLEQAVREAVGRLGLQRA